MVTDKDRVIIVGPDGVASMERALQGMQDEAVRIARVMESGTVPDVCGPDIPHAPARGLVRTFTVLEMVPGSSLRVRDAGYAGRKGLRVGDGFDAMEAAAIKAYDQRKAKDDAAVYDPPFTAGQVSIGRLYAALVEAQSGGTVKCSSFDGRIGGGGGDLDVLDLRLEQANRLERMRARIGRGVAVSVKRARASSGADRRYRIITDRMVVDSVCLDGLTVSGVLSKYHWEPNDKARRNGIREALRGALDRMQGFG
ncbi:hypothetical protein [Roseobacter sp. TSBP12]|uniref:hypothetical protein n=1 Tax=Roseobacter sp. TSBP12 TaxID=1236613 RepID=UPI00125F7357|nr:hypothetical protein [Roseobacter sp. TSBP12]KAB6714318.1 hypothetical protein C8029_21500 [Roseobacter sp. TSBP12]